MSLWRQFTRGLRVLGNRKAADQEIADEVSHYLEEATAALVARGLAPDEARRAARLELGGATAVREQVRGYGWENRVDILFADLRYAARRLAGNPGFTAVSILTLGARHRRIHGNLFGCGRRSTARASLSESAKNRARVGTGSRRSPNEPGGSQFRRFPYTEQHVREPGGICRSGCRLFPAAASLCASTSPKFPAASLKPLGVEPFRGRAFAPEEQRPHGAPAVIVSYSYWQRYLGGAADLSKFHLRMEGGVYPVIGVMPAGFDFPAGVAAWIPREFDPETPSRTAHNWRGLGRVRDGITVAQARANLSAIAHRIKRSVRKRG